MKKIILALALCLVATPALADKPAPQPVHHKKHKKVTIYEVKPLPPLPPRKEPEVVSPEVVIAPLPPVVPTPVPKPLVYCGGAPYKLKPSCPDYENSVFIPSAHIAVGVGGQAPWASGLLGLRMEFPKLYLGLEPFLSVPYGAGIEGMVYAYRGSVVQFYPLSVGFMLNFNYNQHSGAFGTSNKFLSDQDVNRIIDLRLGAGVQVKLACHVLLTLDWRVSIPDPVKLTNENDLCVNCGSNSHRLDSIAALGNAFGQSQLLVGLLIR